MNRRELFAGAGAAALSGVLPAGPATGFSGVTPKLMGEDADGNTSIWVVSWAPGTELPAVSWRSLIDFT